MSNNSIYIEELSNGDCFDFKNNKYVLSSDHKRSGERLCLSLIDGSSRWLKGDTIIEKTQLFFMDKDNNIIAIKESKKENVVDQT
jgi:hypothetical protein